MKLSLATLAIPLFLSACAAHPAPPVQPTKIEVSPEPPKPKESVVSREKWALKLPGTWLVKPEQPENADSKLELFAKSVGASPEITVVVLTTKLDDDDMSDEEFGAAAVIGTARQVRVVKAQPNSVDGMPGSLVMILSPDGALIAQQAVGHGRMGFVVRCGGDAEEGQKVLDACRPVLESFHLKK